MIETDKDNASFRFTVDNFFRSILRRFSCVFFFSKKRYPFSLQERPTKVSKLSWSGDQPEHRRFLFLFFSFFKKKNCSHEPRKNSSHKDPALIRFHILVERR